jgi:hypothetical protein
MIKLDVDKPYTGTVMTISGNVGNGKNTLAVALIRVMSKTCFHSISLSKECPYCIKYGFSQEERKIKAYANFPIFLDRDPSIGVKCQMLKDRRDFIQLPREKSHSVVVIDEPNAWGFDSHGSATDKIGDLIGYTIQHTRKYNRDIIFLTQLWSMVNLRGKRLSQNTIFAIEPTEKEFRYGWYKLGEIIPLTIKKSYARKHIFPYFDSGHIVGDRQDFQLEEKENIGEATIV